MVNLPVYTFQFGPIVPAPDSLQFPIDFAPDEVMTRKNQIFEDIFADLENLAIYENKDSTIPLPIKAVRNKEIIMFYLGEPKNINIVKRNGGHFLDTKDTPIPTV